MACISTRAVREQGPNPKANHRNTFALPHFMDDTPLAPPAPPSSEATEKGSDMGSESLLARLPAGEPRPSPPQPSAPSEIGLLDEHATKTMAPSTSTTALDLGDIAIAARLVGQLSLDVGPALAQHNTSIRGSKARSQGTFTAGLLGNMSTSLPTRFGQNRRHSIGETGPRRISRERGLMPSSLGRAAAASEELFRNRTMFRSGQGTGGADYDFTNLRGDGRLGGNDAASAKRAGFKQRRMSMSDLISHAKQQETRKEPINREDKSTELAKTTDPTKCVVTGDGLLMAMAKQASTFTIEARDERGRRCKSGGDPFLVTARGASVCRVHVADNSDGSYTCEWSPSVSGQYYLSASLYGVALPGSSAGQRRLW